LFVATRPAVGEPEAEAARIAHLVIVPVRPSPDDIEAVGETLKILERLDKGAAMVVNAAKNESRARDARAAASSAAAGALSSTAIGGSQRRRRPAGGTF